MSYLKIYYDKECTQLCSSYDLTPIIRFGTNEIRNIDYWKLNSNEIVTENELISYGEYILKIVENYKSNQLEIKVLDNEETYIQADGELIGSGNFIVNLVPKALSFIVPK